MHNSKNGPICRCRATVSLATRANTDGDTNERAWACRSCVQRGAKHPSTVGHTSAANAVDDANHADAL